MKGILPNLKGSDKILNENYKSLSKISKIDSEKVFHNFINDKRNIVSMNINGIDNNKLLWYLRNYDSIEFVKNVKNLERNMFSLTNDLDREIYILEEIYKLIGSENITELYKSNRIENNLNKNMNIIKEIYEVLINIYNTINKDQYLLTRKCIKIIYEKIKGIIIKYNGF